ncbi:MAG TPA: alpha/beta fold hydrolase [Terracidiphilus sp.]|nr:alpha/beta fold hydrolase [Terracidiphilus sp.]
MVCIAGLSAQTPAGGALQFAELGVCKLVSGQQIEHCRLGYRTLGTLNAERSNAVLFPSWFSGTSDQLRSAVGPQGLVDPAKDFVILVDALGNGVSSSPSNSETQHGPDFPAITMQDMVNSEYRLATETLHLKHLHAVMGISMGGQQTFEWIADYPDFMDVAIPMVGSPRPSSFDELIYHADADAIRRDPDFHGGRYTTPPPMAVAEAILQMQLTSPANYVATHPLDKFPGEWARIRDKGILPFDANDWLAQLSAVMGLDIAHGGSMEEAAKRVKAKLLVVNAAQDHLVNPKPALDFAALAGAKTFILQSDCGHISTACESAALGEQTRAFLDGN